jgi:putative ABC transport system ATP-binding protein
MLKIENISKKFVHKHGQVTALNSISLEISNGEFICITGPSGSGKSTLLLALGGMSSPETGKVFWDNKSIYDMNLTQRAEWRGQNIGFVFQTFNLMPYLNVIENVELALDLSDKQDIKKENILKILDKLKLSDRLDHIPSELSIGQQQRVALARALIKNPQVILADEPTGNLDSQTASEITSILKEINQDGKTIVLVTHDTDLAKIADRNMRIVGGKTS